jgi:hypothetical protein
MFETWNIIDSALSAHSFGHHYWETKTLADELVRRGVRTRILTNKVAPKEEFSGSEIVPAFEISLYTNVSDDPTWSAVENFVLHNRGFDQDLGRTGQALFRNSVALFPTLTERQLLGLFRWLSRFAPEVRPKAAIVLQSPEDWSETNVSARFYKTLGTQRPPALKSDIAIFGRTRHEADLFAKHMGLPAHLFPLVLPELGRQPVRSSASPQLQSMMVSFVGGARPERGNSLIADVVRQCSALDVHFFIQVKGESESAKPVVDALTSLSGLPKVRVHEGQLEPDSYCDAIAAGVVLLPYYPGSYRWRSSGVYQDAKFLDAPVLVMAGTWMADEVKLLGNGLVIEEFSADSIVQCIARAQRDLPSLRAAAVRVGGEFRQHNGVGPCVDAIAAAFAGPAAV